MINSKELMKKELNDLKADLKALKKDLIEYNTKLIKSEERNTAKRREMKKDIARIQTVISSKEKNNE